MRVHSLIVPKLIGSNARILSILDQFLSSKNTMRMHNQKSFSLRVSKDARFQFGYSGPLIPTNRRLSIFAARLSENLTDEDDSAAATADPSDVSTADERLQ